MDAVTVIIPTFNRARLLPRAILSALAAIDDGDAIIVVDDGSTDDTPAAVAPFLDRVRYERISNRGPGAARNYGITLATTPLIAFLDSDDEWFADKLRLQRQLLACCPDVVFCFSDFLLHEDESGREEHDYLKHWHGVLRPWSEILAPGVSYSSLTGSPPDRGDFLVHVGDLYAPLIEGPFVAAWTALVRREMAGNALRFAEDIFVCEDWECFARLSRVGKAAFMACETAINHGHRGSRLTNTHNQFQLLAARLMMTERVWGADPEFLAVHAERYEGIVAAIHVDRIKWLASHGKTRAARLELKAVRHPSRTARVIASLPGPVAHALGTSRRAAIALVHGAMHLIPLIASLWPDA